MQTLLCAPVHNLEIVIGKFLTVWCISLLAATAILMAGYQSAATHTTMTVPLH